MKAVSPIDKVNLGHARTAVEMLEQGGTFEVNSTTKSASLELKADLGLVSGSGLLGELDDIQKVNVETFFNSMSEALIRKS
jgi:hypothetical protein